MIDLMMLKQNYNKFNREKQSLKKDNLTYK